MCVSCSCSFIAYKIGTTKSERTKSPYTPRHLRYTLPAYGITCALAAMHASVLRTLPSCTPLCQIRGHTWAEDTPDATCTQSPNRVCDDRLAGPHARAKTQSTNPACAATLCAPPCAHHVCPPADCAMQNKLLPTLTVLNDERPPTIRISRPSLFRSSADKSRTDRSTTTHNATDQSSSFGTNPSTNPNIAATGTNTGSRAANVPTGPAPDEQLSQSTFAWAAQPQPTSLAHQSTNSRTAGSNSAHNGAAGLYAQSMGGSNVAMGDFANGMGRPSTGPGMGRPSAGPGSNAAVVGRVSVTMGQEPVARHVTQESDTWGVTYPAPPKGKWSLGFTLRFVWYGTHATQAGVYLISYAQACGHPRSHVPHCFFVIVPDAKWVFLFLCVQRCAHGAMFA